MIEIIPNWHPIFVNFTVALFTTSVVFFILGYLGLFIKIIPDGLVTEFEIVARWCLWTAAIATLATIGFGFYAYYTVEHDATSHAVMVVHRNWAIATAIGVFLTACWSIWQHRKHRSITLTFLAALLIVQVLLFTTGWYGAELVFRYGIGVTSLAQPGDVNRQEHHHAH